MIISRWAVIKCRFADDMSDTPPDSLYQQLFTRAGVGTSNMVDFFQDVSHGQLDVGESQVFGWFRLGLNRADFAGNVADSALTGIRVNRNSLFAACRTAAINGGVNLSRFDGVLVSMNRGTPSPDGSTDGVDLWGSADMRVFCDRYGLQPSYLGQEMGHGYGLNHSRRDGSTLDYQDPWDTMSTANAYMARVPAYGLIGPGLNCVNMLLLRWFDRTRLWTAPEGDFDTRIRLRPLHRHDLDGPLAVSLPDPGRPGQSFLIEFRSKTRWDAGVPQSSALMHRAESRISYLIPGSAPGRDDLLTGDAVEFGDAGSPFSNFLRVEVETIDEATQTCVLHIRRRHSTISFDISRISAALSSLQILGRVPVDGSGAILLPGGRIVPVGPRDPMLDILSNIAAVQHAKLFEDTSMSEAAQRAFLTKIVNLASEQIGVLDPFRVPSPERKLVQPPQKPK